MQTITIVKSTWRRNTEFLAYFWAICGFLMALLGSSQIYNLGSTSPAQLQFTLNFLIFVLVWIGGMVMLGLVASFAPVTYRVDQAAGDRESPPT